MLHPADPTKSRSSAMSGPLDERQAGLDRVWNSGHFDTKDITDLLDIKEDAVCRTLHAARDVKGGRA